MTRSEVHLCVHTAVDDALGVESGPMRMRLASFVAALALVSISIACPAPPGGGGPGGSSSLRLAPDTVDFGGVLLGSSTTRQVSAVNDGDKPLAGKIEAPVGDSASSYTIDASQCPSPLAPHALCTINVTCTPSNTGELTATFTAFGAIVSLDAQASGLTFDPTSLTFDVTRPATTKSLTITATNPGTAPLSVSWAVKADTPNPSPFRISSASQTTIAAGASVPVSVTYAPAFEGAATATLLASVCQGDNCSMSVPLAGSAAFPRVDLPTTTLALGDVDVGVTKDASFDVDNTGGTDLHVSNVSIVDNAGFLTVDATTFPVVVAPRSSTTFQVHYAPTQGVTSYAAAIHVSSDDPARPDAVVAVTARTLGAGLVASPSSLDFSPVTEGVQKTKSITLTSTGNADVVITSIAVPGGAPFDLDPATLPALPLTLAPTDSVTIHATATARAVDLQSGATGEIDVVTGSLPTLAIPVHFAAGGASGCQPAGGGPLNTVDIGNVGQGDTEPGVVTFHNNGTSDCVLASATPTPGSFNAAFTFDATGITTIPPGGQGDVLFEVTPPSSSGTLRATVDVTFENIAATTASAKANSVPITLTEAPAPLDLGAEAQLCAFGSLPFVVTNSQPVIPASITSIDLEPPDAPFTLVSSPAVPFSITTSIGLTVGRLGRASDAVGVHTGLLVLKGTANAVKIPITLEIQPLGTPRVEHFDHSNFVPIDILFIVDNSGSMAPHQSELTQGFHAFINQPEIVDGLVNFHIGVTTTDVDSTGQRGALQGPGFVMTNDTPDLDTVFGPTASVGDGGSGVERAFSGFFEALTEPKLSGVNAGFLRQSDDVALAIVIVSDEDDQSDQFNTTQGDIPPPGTGAVTDFVDFLTNLKPSGAITVSAVRTIGNATRYDELVAAFPGPELDIQDNTWPNGLGQFGADVLAPALQRQVLFKVAAPVGDLSTLTATVAGQPVAIDSYDPVEHVVKLAQPLVDGAGGLDITYVAQCP